MGVSAHTCFTAMCNNVYCTIHSNIWISFLADAFNRVSARRERNIKCSCQSDRKQKERKKRRKIRGILKIKARFN